MYLRWVDFTKPVQFHFKSIDGKQELHLEYTSTIFGPTRKEYMGRYESKQAALDQFRESKGKEITTRIKTAREKAELANTAEETVILFPDGTTDPWRI